MYKREENPEDVYTGFFVVVVVVVVVVLSNTELFYKKVHDSLNFCSGAFIAVAAMA